MKLSDILRRVQEGTLPAEDAERFIRQTAESNLGFARIDIGRLSRCGMAEIIFCPGKTPDQVLKIIAELVNAKQNVLATRATQEQYETVRKKYSKAVYHELPRAITLKNVKSPVSKACIAVVCAGTSDIPIAEEAALASEWMGVRAERIYDVGVAGLHRLLNQMEPIRNACAIVVAAGMEGALPSVVGGLVDRPIIAVPTSVGYGASMNGMAALFAMLNSCVPGITVVNIDNGLGAGIAAALIGKTGESQA